MKNFMDFITAALPWLCMGGLLAVFFAKSAEKKKDNKKKENYSVYQVYVTINGESVRYVTVDSATGEYHG